MAVFPFDSSLFLLLTEYFNEFFFFSCQLFYHYSAIRLVFDTESESKRYQKKQPNRSNQLNARSANVQLGAGADREQQNSQYEHESK